MIGRSVSASFEKFPMSVNDESLASLVVTAKHNVGFFSETVTEWDF